MIGFVRTLMWPSKRLPDDIFGELVDIIFTSLPPVALIGVTLSLVGFLLAEIDDDAILWVLTALAAAITAGRILLILTYRSRASREDIQDAPRWERRYAAGAYGFALVLGAFNLRAITIGDPWVAMLVTSVMFRLWRWNCCATERPADGLCHQSSASSRADRDRLSSQCRKRR